VKRRAHEGADVEAARLRSAAVDDWLSPIERLTVVALVDEAREAWTVDRNARTRLDNVAPGAQYPARLLDDRARAIELVERMIVSHRRSVAGWRFAAAHGLDGVAVAASYGIGHVSRPDPAWLAAEALDQLDDTPGPLPPTAHHHPGPSTQNGMRA
jgi:hypothetical protein